MTPDGHFTFFSLSTAAFVQTITNDGNGSLIFTEVDTNKLGIITIQGSISRLFSIPQTDASPGSVLMRVPGEYWFTEVGNSTVTGMGMIARLKTI
jgi:streptogramin lyase